MGSRHCPCLRHDYAHGWEPLDGVVTAVSQQRDGHGDPGPSCLERSYEGLTAQEKTFWVIGTACEKSLGQEQATLLEGPEETCKVNQELHGMPSVFPY